MLKSSVTTSTAYNDQFCIHKISGERRRLYLLKNSQFILKAVSHARRTCISVRSTFQKLFVSRFLKTSVILEILCFGMNEHNR